MKWLNAFSFAAGYALIATALMHMMPPVRPSQLGAKLDWLADHGAKFDTFFIGSSRVHRQIVPDIFDSEMAAHGLKTSSYNLAGDGMRPPEDEFVMEHAFANRTAPLRLLLVECNFVELKIPDGDAGTSRAIYWHDAARMKRLWRCCWSSGRGFTVSDYATRAWKGVRQFPAHIQHWIWSSGRLGLGNDLLTATFLGAPPRDDTRELGASGYRPPKAVPPMNGSALRDYEKDLAAVRKNPPQHSTEDYESQAALAWKKQLAEKLGARLVLIASPYPKSKTFAPRDDITFLDFSDPNRYPELYVPEHRRDHGHLNVRGSEIYTRHIARQIAEALKPQP